MVHDGNNLNWEVISYPSWLTPNVTTGNTTRSVDFTASSNAGAPQRTGTITVRDKTFNIDYTVNVKQLSGYKFEVSPASLSFVGAGESKTITITNPYGCNWSITSPAGWITASPTTGNSNATVTVTAGANGWDARTSTLYVEETTYGGGAEVALSQASGYTLSYSPTAFTFNAVGESKTLTYVFGRKNAAEADKILAKYADAANNNRTMIQDRLSGSMVLKISPRLSG